METQLTPDQSLRLQIVMAAGFTLEEVLLVYQFVNGNDGSISELIEFRKGIEKNEKELTYVISNS